MILALVLGLASLVGLRARDVAAAPATASGVTGRPGRLTLAWMRLRGPPRVGVQIGHLRAAEHPDELAHLRLSTGGHAAGVDEVDVNAAIGRALADCLERRGVRVDLLPAPLPPRYRADALLAIHADASPDPDRRGYKSSHARDARNPLEPRLAAAVDAAYLAAAPLPHDATNVSGGMLDYYAFDDRRYRHAAHRATPALIVETGYLSHPADRAWLLEPAGPAAALCAGVSAYLARVGRWHPAAAASGGHGS